MPERELPERLKRRSLQLLAEPVQDKARPHRAVTALGSSPHAIQRAHSLDPANVLTLQRSVGNQAVQRMLAAQRLDPVPSGVQRPRALTAPNRGDLAPTKSAATLSPHPKHTVQRAPQTKSISRAPAGQIQRAGNWDNFKNFAKGQGKGFANDQQWWLDEMNPANNKGVGKVTKPLLTSPFAALQMGLSGAGRGAATLGAGAYYGAKGLGSGAMSVGSSMGRGAMSLGRGIGRRATNLGNRAKTAYNKDRNPHGYDRNRLPTTGSSALEVGKPGAAIGVSGATLGASEVAGGTGMGFPAGSGMLNVISAADAALTWYNGSKMAAAAKGRNDLAGEKVGGRKANQGKWGVMAGVAGATQGALNLGTVVDVGSQGMMSMNDILSSANYVSSGLGMAGAAAGIAGGAVTAGQGMWKAGKAYTKLYKLSKSAPMLSEDGDRWRARIKDREKNKAGFNTLKAVAGVLGIAAGALVIASNPVGWALGVAAAVVGGGLVAKKLYTKWKKSKRKQQAKAGVRADMEKEERERDQAAPNDMPALEDINDNNGQQNNEQQQGQDDAGMQQADPTKLDQAKRKQANELGNRVAQKVSKSAKVAGEIRGALASRNDPMFGALTDSLQKKQFTHEFLRQNNKKDYPFPKHVLRVHDALVMLSVLNLTPEQVESESGQELIEKKLSVSDSL